MNQTLPTIVISAGDPAGIGPEVAIKALHAIIPRDLARWVLVIDRAVLDRAASQTGLTLPADVVVRDPGALQTDYMMGQLSADCGRAALEYVRQATELCLNEQANAMVTAPLNKESVNLLGIKFTGHTEFIAELCDSSQSRMLLINPRLMVLHVTTHCALRQACQLSADRVLSTLRIGQETLTQLGRRQAAIGVCGLNPHAGEHGLFGDEDRTQILPAVEQAQAEGINVQGPIPADTAFLRGVRGEFDMVVAMYHDQGHIPMKLLDFDNTVNVSLGLPIIRTSVDHGTAFEIAGQNRANPANMQAAMELAVEFAIGRGSHG